MRSLFTRVCGIFAFCGVTFAAALTAAQEPTPVGLWVTIDDKTSKPSAVVDIVLRDGELSGIVRQIFPQSGQEADPRCEKCTDARKDQPIKGMQILWGMKRTEEGYGGGHILDPDEGTVYRCRLRLSADGRQLQVHGYVGIPLLGRTQVWLRQAPTSP